MINYLRHFRHSLFDHRPAQYHYTNKGYFWWCEQCETGTPNKNKDK